MYGLIKDEVLYYTMKDDIVHIFAQVNQPAFLRILYTLADGKQALLDDNISISPDQVDKPVEIGTYICTKPFGKELLHIAARTEQFQKIDTYIENGYNIIDEKDPKEVMKLYRTLPKKYSKTRGLQKYEERQTIGPEVGFQQSEVRLTITTMKK